MLTSSVAAVIVNFNSCDHVAACLASLYSGDSIPCLVWDNGSAHDDVEQLRLACGAYPSVTLVESPDNLGFGAAVNQAVDAVARAHDIEFAWVLNPDVVIHADALKNLVAAAKRHKYDILSPLILTPSTPSRIWYAGGVVDRRAGRSIHSRIGELFTDESEGVEDVSFVTGAAPLIRIESWQTLGGFREDLFLYCEDAELSMRWYDRGMKLGFCRDAVVTHAEGGSSGSGGPSATFYYFVQRNRLIIYRRYSSILNLLLGQGAFETLRLLVFPFRRRSGSVRRFRASLLGVWDGLSANRDAQGTYVTSSSQGRLRDV